MEDDTEVIYDRFGKFAQVDGNADVGIVVLGENPYAEGRGDRADLTLNPTIVKRVRERVDTLILLIVAGRPMVITEALGHADAVVMAWLPGTEGDGVAEVLLGDYEFTGKLPFTWMRSMDQLPFNFEEMDATLFVSGCDAPLFPFGYSLTMAKFTPFVLPACGGL